MSTTTTYVVDCLDQIEESVLWSGSYSMEWWEVRDVGNYSDSIPEYDIALMRARFTMKNGWAHCNLREDGNPRSRHSRQIFSESFSSLVQELSKETFGAKEDAARFVAGKYIEAIDEAIDRVNDCLRALNQPELGYPLQTRVEDDT